MELRFDDRALLLGETLVLADCHLGKGEANVELPIGDTTDVIDRFEALLDAHSPETVVIAGDLLHSYSTIPASIRDAIEALESTARSHDVDLVVLGTHGRTGLDQYVLGTVAERTLRESSVPVVTVHEETVVAEDLETILVPTDGSDCSAVAAAHAVTLAEATGASLHVVHVVDLGVLPVDGSGALLDELQQAGQHALESVIDRAEDVSSVQASLLSGSPHSAIVDYAEDESVDLVVMGTHGRTGFDRYLLGSVTERVVRLSDRPVLTLDDHEGA